MMWRTLLLLLGFIGTMGLGHAQMQVSVNGRPAASVNPNDLCDYMLQSMGYRPSDFAVRTGPRVEEHPTEVPDEGMMSPGAHMMLDAIDANAPLMDRVQHFSIRWSDRVALVDNVSVALNQGSVPMSQHRRVLIIDTKNLNEADRVRMQEDYMAMIGKNTVSFPMNWQGGHLYTRVGEHTYDFHYGVSKNAYAIRSNDHHMETVIQLSDSEFARLQNYVESAHANPNQIVGPFQYNGTSRTNLQLGDNRSVTPGEGHNCTSWLSLAPIGDHGEPLKKLIGASGWDVHRNPGWWTAYINAKVGPDRSPFTVYFAGSSLVDAERELTQTGLGWNYDPH